MFELSGNHLIQVNKSTDGRRFLTSTLGAVALFVAASLWPLSSQAEDAADVDQFLATGVCPDCDLAGANFDVGSHSAAVLSGASLYGTSFLGADLSYADLSNANLGLAILEGANLSGANLSGADLWRAQLTGADLTDAVTDETTTCPDASSGPCLF